MREFASILAAPIRQAVYDGDRLSDIFSTELIGEEDE
jgi:hypothetical protein